MMDDELTNLIARAWDDGRSPIEERPAVDWSRQRRGVPLLGSLPFDQDSTDERLTAVLLHRDITWINRISGRQATAVVGVIHGITRRIDGDDYVTFIDQDGYHSVYLNQIIAVG